VQKAKPTTKNSKASKEAPNAKKAAPVKPTKPSKSSVPVKESARSNELVSESDSSSAEGDAESTDDEESDDAAESMVVDKPKEKAIVLVPDPSHEASYADTYLAKDLGRLFLRASTCARPRRISMLVRLLGPSRKQRPRASRSGTLRHPNLFRSK
jgi:hypothetical protein